ncbi:NAD(P)-dependent alcohol dehydrogenase [Algibacter sp. PT7-4]|uniref:NAD(P)-dependent alcohol dehydrogenase n=1 Tax=Algibacter ulvanivorans TaxID=3400999 RepID=UPI003AADEED3
MKAAIYNTYGKPNVIKVVDAKKPIPKANEVLVKIKASSVTHADVLMRKGTPKFGRLFLGLFKPKNKTLGTGFSGIVERVGNKVSKFNVNDEVFGEVLFANGTNAEFVCIQEDAVIAKKPNNITHQEAAPICDGFLTSYSFFKDVGKLKEGQHILINGASGSLGTAAVQLAKVLGAKVTGVCSASNTELVKSLGADFVINYKKKDFTKSGEYYDFIFDAVGKSSYKKCKSILTFNGVFMSPVLSCSVLWYAIVSSKKVKFSATGIRKQEDLKKLLDELVVLFKLKNVRTIIDKTYTIQQIINAHTYIETGRKRGNVVIIN